MGLFSMNRCGAARIWLAFQVEIMSLSSMAAEYAFNMHWSHKHFLEQPCGTKSVAVWWKKAANVLLHNNYTSKNLARNVSINK